MSALGRDGHGRVLPGWRGFAKANYSTTYTQGCRVNDTFVRFVHVLGPKSVHYSTQQVQNSSGV